MMSVTFNDDGSTRMIGNQPFKDYVRAVWEGEDLIDLADFDPDDHEQICNWVFVWETHGDED